MLEELRTPLEKVWTDEFNRYAELFYKYLPKRPFHHRFRYGDGFICAKGKYKGRDEKYDRTAAPPSSASTSTSGAGRTAGPRRTCSPNYWIAMIAGKKSALKAMDFDNKQNLLGYYQDVGGEARADCRPCRWSISRRSSGLYDAFPGHVWCISSATLGLHAMAADAVPCSPSRPSRPPTDQGCGRSGSASTEIHPMFGRCFRRPFGQDYFTITDNGLLEHWVKQLDWFEKVAEPPSFGARLPGAAVAAAQGMGRLLPAGTMEKVGPWTGKPHLLKYFKGKDVFNSGSWTRT